MDALARQLETARRRLAAAPCRVHMVGAGGVGMAGLARLLAARGFRVDGCDRGANRLTAWLAARGVPVGAGHDPGHVRAADWIVHTPAVPAGHPELEAARAAGLDVTRRGAVLPALLDGPGAVAVAGTHGKTTVTAMAAQALSAAGLDPGYALGGECEALDGAASPGGGRFLVAEADESDGTLGLYAPAFAVITNIDFDHMEHFAGEEAFFAVFRRFARQVRGTLFYGADDARAADAGRSRPGSVGFGLGEGACVRAVRLEPRPFGTAFDLLHGGRRLGRIELPVPGEHNVRNALAAAAVCLACGAAFGDVARGLAAYRGPRRRLERVAERDGVTVFSDYAHHPTEIRALLASLRGFPHRRIRAVFQPHRFTRTRALGPAFPPAFAGVDELILVPVYAASEPPLAGGSSQELLAHFERAGFAGVRYERGLEGAWERLRDGARPGDVLLVIGAGDVERIAGRAAAWGRERA